MLNLSPTLNELANSEKIKAVFSNTVKEIFGKKDSRTAHIELPHGVLDSTWTTGEHLGKLSREISKTIDSYVMAEIAKKQKSGGLKKFDPNKTKLTFEYIEMNNIWELVSKWIGERIGELAQKENTDIPGLEKGVKEGVILTVPGKTVPQTTVEERELARDKYKQKLPRINDEIAFLERFRNNLYEYFVENYGVHKEYRPELGKLNKS